VAPRCEKNTNYEKKKRVSRSAKEKKTTAKYMVIKEKDTPGFNIKARKKSSIEKIA